MGGLISEVRMGKRGRHDRKGKNKRLTSTQPDNSSCTGQCRPGHSDMQLRLLGVIRWGQNRRIRADEVVVAVRAARPADTSTDAADLHKRLLDGALQHGAFARAHGDLSALFVEHVGVGLELEEEVRGVHDQQDDGGAAGQCGDGPGLGRAELVEAGRDDDTADGQGKEGGGGLRDGLVEVLLLPAQAAEEEAHAHDEEEVGEDAAYEGGLHDHDLALGECDDGHDHLDSVTRGCQYDVILLSIHG